MPSEEELDSERRFEAKIIVSVETPCMIAQILDLEVTPDRDLVLFERTSTIALQRQVRQNFAAGRFENEASASRYDDIGRLMFIPAKMPLRIKYEGSSSISLVRCMFPPATFSDIFTHEDKSVFKTFHRCLNIKSRIIRELMIRVSRELENYSDYTETLAQNYGNILIIELKRYFGMCAADNGIARGGMAAGVLRRLIERIEGDLEPPTLDELAAISGLSKRHLCRSFRQSTGQTVLEKINEVRFSRALLSISNGSININDIAKEAGYKSLSSFSQAYKNWYGKSPTNYKPLYKLD